MPSSRLMSAVIDVIVCSVSTARVRTDSILRKSWASSSLADCMRWRLESSLYACTATRAEMEVERSSWWVWMAVAVAFREVRVEGWENIVLRCSIGS